MARIGTKPGYVHCWGHTGARYIGDISLTSIRNFIGGQKEDETDSTNVNYDRDFTCEKLADIAMAKEGYLTEDGKQKLLSGRGIEVGNIFQLGYHYTHLMKNATFVDKDGTLKPYYMGCYGIGIGRTLATIVEVYHDEKGIIWPAVVAPYKFHLLVLGDDKKVRQKAENVYKQLEATGQEVLFDDRDLSAGEKFADADLIGITFRLVVSEKTGDKVEVKKRDEKASRLVSISELLS